MPEKVALVFGASGVTGWSFVNEILNDYPEKGTWGKVYALTNRPLSQEDSMWPKDDRLSIVSGIDLLKGSQEDLEEELKTQVKSIEKVTHVYYLAFKASRNLHAELKDAVDMFKRSTTAMDHLSPALEFVVLQTGAKMYACHLLATDPTYVSSTGIFVPYKESMPRIKQPYADLLFYHPQMDWVTEYAKDKKWNWCDTRPDIIIGFVPNQNFYSLGTVLGIFFSLYRAVEGEGAEVPFPGTDKSWVAKGIESSSDMIARQTLHLSLTLPPSQKGEGFNVADAKYPSTWEQKWPALADYFGLKGTGPVKNGASPIEIRKYINDHIDEWKKLEEEHGLKKGIANSDLTFQGFEYFLMTQFDFDRQYDMTKMYSTGFTEEQTPIEAWGNVFDRMRKGKLMP